MISLSPAEYELMLHLVHFVGLTLAAGGVGTILGVLAVKKAAKPTKAPNAESSFRR